MNASQCSNAETEPDEIPPAKIPPAKCKFCGKLGIHNRKVCGRLVHCCNAPWCQEQLDDYADNT